MTDSADLPSTLIGAVRAQEAILFLGAGASKGARHPTGAEIPIGTELRDRICDECLEGELKDRPLPQVAEIAIYKVGFAKFQLIIRDIFKDFQPCDFHKIVPLIRWNAIATTNIDLITERAYDQVSSPLGSPVAFLKDTQSFDVELKRSPNSLPLFKLHGSVDAYTDEQIPFILSSEQYVKYGQKRKFLFSRFSDLARQYPVIFCGYSISDPNIQAILFDIFDLSIPRPQYYVILSTIEPLLKEYWASRRITPLTMTFSAFLNALVEAIPAIERALPSGLGGGAASIRKHYRTPGISESQNVLAFLDHDADHVRPGLPIIAAPAKDFYVGRDVGWAGIAADLDVRRRLSDTVLVTAILADESERGQPVDLHVVKSPAGNGKSIAPKRIAWDAANDYDKLVLFLRQGGALRPEAILDVYSYCQERVFLFVDRAALRVQEILDVIRVARAGSVKLTILTAERDNEWNVRCDELDQFNVTEYPLPYLSEREIGDLLVKLDEHDSLGVLRELTAEQRVQVFLQRAQRQLLVALHEATQGKRFEEIIVDEYNRIEPLEARQLYLDVCTLNRLGVGVRAGLVSRVSGIRFTDFHERLLKPLERVVSAYRDQYAADMMYTARHPHIAEIVFSNVLLDVEDRYGQMLNIIQAMNLSYSSDAEAFRQLSRGRAILETFHQSRQLGRAFYNEAERIAPGNPHLLQQKAIFEMSGSDEDLSAAEDALDRAVELAGHDRSIRHSSAMLARQQAQKATDPLLREKYRRTARERLGAVTRSDARRPHGFHTAALLYLDELRDALTGGISDSRLIVSICNDFEATMARALQKFPDEAELLSLQSEYYELIQRDEQAWMTLRRAFEKNPRLDWIGVSLARRLERAGEPEEAKKVLRMALEKNSESQRIHLAIARLLMEYGDQEEKERVLDHLGASFIQGDSNYDAQFWYARELFLRGREDARKQFDFLKRIAVPSSVRRRLRGILRNSEGKPLRVEGRVVSMEEGFLFVRPDRFQWDVFSHMNDNDDKTWAQLGVGMRVSFELGFTMSGPGARAIRAARI